MSNELQIKVYEAQIALLTAQYNMQLDNITKSMAKAQEQDSINNKAGGI